MHCLVLLKRVIWPKYPINMLWPLFGGIMRMRLGEDRGYLFRGMWSSRVRIICIIGLCLCMRVGWRSMLRLGASWVSFIKLRSTMWITDLESVAKRILYCMNMLSSNWVRESIRLTLSLWNSMTTWSSENLQSMDIPEAVMKVWVITSRVPSKGEGVRRNV